MSNYTFEIQEALIPGQTYKNPAGNFMRGKIHWKNGEDSEKNFHTFSESVISLIEANQGQYAVFSVKGTLTKKPGKKGTQWESKFFEELQILEIRVVQEGKKFSARELVEEAKAEQEGEDTPW
jgi:hypothetical protein